ncbi:MAG: hypothetical protein IJX63_16050 [Lachnospiraceae bacterium]|nr:hypothetical protein [Lachnospiraceae bacterium]
MKKKIEIGVVIAVLLLLVAVVVWFFSRNLTFSTARCIFPMEAGGWQCCRCTGTGDRDLERNGLYY